MVPIYFTFLSVRLLKDYGSRQICEILNALTGKRKQVTGHFSVLRDYCRIQQSEITAFYPDYKSQYEPISPSDL